MEHDPFQEISLSSVGSEDLALKPTDIVSNFFQKKEQKNWKLSAGAHLSFLREWFQKWCTHCIFIAAFL